MLSDLTRGGGDKEISWSCYSAIHAIHHIKLYNKKVATKVHVSGHRVYKGKFFIFIILVRSIIMNSP